MAEGVPTPTLHAWYILLHVHDATGPCIGGICVRAWPDRDGTTGHTTFPVDRAPVVSTGAEHVGPSPMLFPCPWPAVGLPGVIDALLHGHGVNVAVGSMMIDLQGVRPSARRPCMTDRYGVTCVVACRARIQLT
ncbi:uncharacterized protein LOC123452533 [Hordeum vulgare subsp. vulgare]|uniref:Predicted protein n=1 Tax=Hordeum vulgare subsp. vulgare TaxID=112509 RepID=F2EG54_HORVV|nr:uncharacterized protein LOC123452533 [Hordeum vulgare subsp. vulgare]BAK06326.1 predicted protein [Hordeum vulgare subsp. vulgare]